MSFDGNGNWVADFSAKNDRDANIKILASRFDDIHQADLKASFENCLTKDMQVKPLTNFNANNHRIINVEDPIADTDAVNKQTMDSQAVHKTGNETIGGDKTFTGTVVVPTPASATDNSTKAATTAWVNNHFNNASVKKSLVTLMAPKWSSRSSISSGYTATGNGWVIWQDNKYNSNDHYISINGNEIARTGGQRGDWAESSQCQVMISSGDKVTYVGGTCWFVPCIGG